MIFIILITMLFLHIVDDYYLQGILSSMKQKSWWDANIKNKEDLELYKNDYLMALFEHGLSWSFVVSLPMTIYFIMNNYIVMFNYDNPDVGKLVFALLYTIFILLQGVNHSIIDNKKANLHEINLIKDQCLHFIQILVNWIIFVIVISVK